jgi:beta-1,2-mannobiose phosphorylase / 1,2-beta-oligomannan phosphorylase
MSNTIKKPAGGDHITPQMLPDEGPVYEPGPARSIQITHGLQIERMHAGRPILTPREGSDWESRVVLNPGVVLVDDPVLLQSLIRKWGLDDHQKKLLLDAGAAAVMLYRAQGRVVPSKGLAPSYMGLAVFTPLLELVWRRETPVISPVDPFHNLGVEDGRCSYINGEFRFLYTGHYRDEKQDRNSVHICLATTHDFINWKLHGPLKGNLNDVDNKNAVLFPDKIHGNWVMLHRPMAGLDPKSIHWAESGDLQGPWEGRGMLMASYQYREFRQSWIGAGGPPLALGDNRFLVIYHQGHFAPNNEREYDLAATIVDFPEPGVCRAGKRIEPLMRPTGAEEQKGDARLGVDNVLFTCANYLHGDDLIIPYAGADSRIFGARINLKHLLDELENA